MRISRKVYLAVRRDISVIPFRMEVTAAISF